MKNILIHLKSEWFKYGLETLVVVVGILMAFLLSNWNEQRKERLLENKILLEINSNLKHDLKEIRTDLKHRDLVNLACKEIVSLMETSETPNEKFFYDVGMLRVTPHFDPNNSGYTLLESKGVEIVQNDSLRRSLSLLYESTYVYYHRYEQEQIQFRIHTINPKLVEYFTWFSRPGLVYSGQYEVSDQDYLMLKNNASFLRLIHAAAYENEVVNDRARKVEKAIVSLMTSVQYELDAN